MALAKILARPGLCLGLSPNGPGETNPIGTEADSIRGESPRDAGEKVQYRVLLYVERTGYQLSYHT